MTGSGQSLLRQLMLNYDELKMQLARRLGSVERARDALQETWLRLDRAAPIAFVERPQPYILKVAYRLALKRRQRERETMTLDDARAALDLADDAPDQARVAEARSEVMALNRALAELSPRRRDILMASRVDNVPLSEIALRYGISQRMVEMELKVALMHCGERLGRKVVQRFGPRPLKGSSHQETSAQKDRSS